MAPIPWTDLATKDDLADLRGDMARLEAGLRVDIDGLRRDMNQLDNGLRRDFAQLETSLHRDMAQLDSGHDLKLEALEGRLSKQIAESTRLVVVSMLFFDVGCDRRDRRVRQLGLTGSGDRTRGRRVTSSAGPATGLAWARRRDPHIMSVTSPHHDGTCSPVACTGLTRQHRTAGARQGGPRMCMRCDGYSWEEIDRATDLAIQVNGFTMLQVEDDLPWTYTIGVRESWAQPELLVVDIDAVTQADLIRTLADDYLSFGELRQSTLDRLDVELVTVDEAHFRDGLVAAWEDHYSMSATTGDFLQIVPGRSWFCDCHEAMVRRLDDRDVAPARLPNQ